MNLNATNVRFIVRILSTFLVGMGVISEQQSWLIFDEEVIALGLMVVTEGWFWWQTKAWPWVAKRWGR